MVVDDDRLSDAARAVLRAGNASAYSRLVLDDRAGLDDSIRQQLLSLTAERVLARPRRSSEAGAALLAGLWLWHDFLDESHTIAQGLHSATGSFWHAIMHRREGDFSNSKYWYARCREHPAISAIKMGADAFVDLVARVCRNPNDPQHAAAAEMQRREWQSLFSYCLNQASPME
jgi:hypothetical protein